MTREEDDDDERIHELGPAIDGCVPGERGPIRQFLYINRETSRVIPSSLQLILVLL